MITKNLIVSISELMPSGEEKLVDIRTTNDPERPRFVFTAPEMILSCDELIEAMAIAKKFRLDNPQEVKVKELVVKTDAADIEVMSVPEYISEREHQE